MENGRRAYGELAADAPDAGGRDLFALSGGRREAVSKPALLLHSCCGPCCTAVTERLAAAYRITVFFYNPNIHGQGEYERRRAAQLAFIDRYNRRADPEDRIAFMEGAYEPEVFEGLAKGLEGEPEGGERCRACIGLRLERTAETAILMGFEAFTTTLSVSPHKSHALISRIGGELGARCRVHFIAEDFKKRAGWQRSVQLSAEYGLYRQKSCGCRFSAE
ncbi:MAG: epoxyqueuosine reductase QueH [Clostridiales Family XIII bacterium]|jgi:predicted adenine nucleotide alpha hydrolase (AANH) superfamily ATPase|nr:epoxyqueuosine reductase QueH [Clostridiales Family XIII bacterium]